MITLETIDPIECFMKQTLDSRIILSVPNLRAEISRSFIRCLSSVHGSPTLLLRSLGEPIYGQVCVQLWLEFSLSSTP